jgi:hypothetical protein
MVRCCGHAVMAQELAAELARVRAQLVDTQEVLGSLMDERAAAPWRCGHGRQMGTYCEMCGTVVWRCGS